MTTITVPRELLERALNWVTLNAWHPDDCDVFDLDDDGRHCACSCGMTTLIEALTAALAQQAEPSGWVCPKCRIDRLTHPCPKGHTAALTDECPMVATAYAAPKESSNG